MVTERATAAVDDAANERATIEGMSRRWFIVGCSAALAACESFEGIAEPGDAAADVAREAGAPRDAGTDADASADAGDGGSVDAGAPHLVFLSSKLLYGDMAYKTQAGKDLAGVDGADAACQDEANAEGLLGTYAAWLSTDGEDAIDHIGTFAGPWVLANRTAVRVALGRGDLASSLREPIDSLANGTIANGNMSTFTGTGADGKRAATACRNFKVKDGIVLATIGDPTSRDKWTANDGFAACNAPRRVYCFQR